MNIRVALDVMGGDYAPDAALAGAATVLANTTDVHLLLVGQEQALASSSLPAQYPGRVELLVATDEVPMDEAPAVALKTRPESSMHLGIAAVKEGRADAFVSAGNTGAVMAISLVVLGRIKGVSRPTVMGYMPTTTGMSILVDAGANVDCKPEHLVQFALMGNVYAQRILRLEKPSVGLLNVGSEKSKGNELAKSSYGKLASMEGLHFMGNVEGRDVLHGRADVVVCDGFVGNVLLKFGESISTAIPEMLAQTMSASNTPAQTQQAVAGVLRETRKRFDYEEYGGAPLLGVRGPVLIGHGASSPRAFEKLIGAAVDVTRQDVVGAIVSAIEQAPLAANS